MKVTLIRNYNKKNKQFLKGQVIEVMPWFKDELENGDGGGTYLKKTTMIGIKKVHTRTKND